MELGLEGKVDIVTGGGDGIGKAAAQRLAREGARVAICARRQEVLEKTAAELSEKTGGTVVPVKADVTNPDDIQRVIQVVVERFGRLDILVNNAGRSAAAPFEQATDEAWQEDFDLKLWAAVRFARAVIPDMRKVGGGRIINVTTPGGKAPGPGSVPTSVTRAAGIALTKALSKDLAKDNILVNTVCVGSIKSGQWERRYQQARKQEPSLTLEEFYGRMGKEGKIPLGRIGEAEEAGDVIAFLASERASFVTGTSVNIDGGASAVI